MLKRYLIRLVCWMIAFNVILYAVAVLWRALDMWQFGNSHESISDTIAEIVIAWLLADKLEALVDGTN